MSVKIIKVYHVQRKLTTRIGSEHNKFIAGLSKIVEIMEALLRLNALRFAFSSLIIYTGMQTQLPFTTQKDIVKSHSHRVWMPHNVFCIVLFRCTTILNTMWQDHVWILDFFLFHVLRQ